ncbi:fimbrillin family protein [Hoylesella enoeca]|uniref:fimbrillin family protein n=1 Tax=Hoylesella enoeca TaxID=76123 RepID=UPI00405935EB
MKKYSKYHFPILLLLMAAGLVNVSCADEDLSNNANDRNGVSFAVSDVQDAPDADLPSLTKSKEAYLTRSIDFNEAGTADMCLEESTVPGVNPMKRTPQTRAWLKSTIDANFGAFACQNGSAGPDYFDNEQVTPSGQMLQPKRWDASASSLKFYAVYPYMDGTNAQQKLVYPTTGSLPYVAFEASTDIANQTDLMTAETATINYTSTGGAPHVVPLKFYHALTAIRFGIGSNLSGNKTIKSIEFQGIYKAGHFDLATKAWSNQSGTQNFKLDNVNQSTSGTLNTVIVKDGNTFLMVPQTLPSGAKIVITFADNSQITANIGGKTWAPGTTKTYMMTEKNSDWEYKIETTDPAVIAYDQTMSTTPYTIKSYRQSPGGTDQQPVKWKVVSYQESADGGLTWGAETQTKPDWLTNLTTENGDGGTAAESGTATVKIDVIDHLAAYNAVLQTATPKGSAGNYHDLSMHDFKDNPTAQRNTANSYLISAPGYYKIPLVYGNAITNGTPNTHAYISQAPTGTPNEPRVLRTFKDHNEQNITSPYINVQNSAAPATQAAIVWTDQSGIVEASSLGIEGSGTNAFVHFRVPQDKIKNGNAVIAVKNASGTIMWSWHLWFDRKEVLETVKCTNYQGVDYNFTKQTLGFAYRKWEGTTYDKPRVARVKVEQTIADHGAKQFAYIDIKQNPNSVKEISSTFYQFGRKDAFPGVNSVSDGSFNENGGNNTSIQNGIQHPETFYIWGSNYNWYNLWSMDNTTTGYNNNAVVKTVYDPCPAGFKMPASNAFTGFTTTGNGTGNQTEWNVSGDWDYGWNFNNKISNPDATVYFPASGFRSGSLGDVGTDGYHWSAVPVIPYSNLDGCNLFFNQWYVQTNGNNSYSCGYAARPVADE